MSANLNARAVDTRPLQELMDTAKEHCSRRGQSVVIYGPGATRTQFSDELAEHYACSTIVIDWHHMKDRPIPRDAILLCERRPAGPFAIDLQIVRYAEALAAIGFEMEDAP